MSKNRFVTVTAAVLLAALLVACGGGGALVNKEWMEKNKDVNWSPSQGLVLPIDIHMGGNDAMRAAMQLSLAAGFMVPTEGRWIALQPAILIPPFSNNLSHEMTYNVRHMADFHKSWDPRQDVHGGKPDKIVALIQQLPNAVSLALKKAEPWIKEKLNKPNFKAPEPRFLIVAHIDAGEAKTLAGKGYRSAAVKAALYDSHAGVYLSYVEFDSRFPWTGKTTVDQATLVGKMFTMGSEILAELTAPMRKKK